MAADLNGAVEKAMSDAFRAHTGTPVGQEMWNLNMERTWEIVAPAAVAAVRAEVAEEIAQAIEAQVDGGTHNMAAMGFEDAARIAREHGKEK